MVLLGTTLVVAAMVSAQSVLARSHSGSSGSTVPTIPRCTATGNVTYMYWGDSGDNAAHKSSIAVAEKKCKGLHVNPIWDSGNYDTDLATKIGSGNAPDLFQLDASKRIPQYVTQGALAPLDTFVKQQKIDLTQHLLGAVRQRTDVQGACVRPAAHVQQPEPALLQQGDVPGQGVCSSRRTTGRTPTWQGSPEAVRNLLLAA